MKNLNEASEALIQLLKQSPDREEFIQKARPIMDDESLHVLWDVHQAATQAPYKTTPTWWK